MQTTDFVYSVEGHTTNQERQFHTGQMDTVDKKSKNDLRRNLASFWIFGLCNNFAYVVMLSAAHDILEDHSADANHTNPRNSSDPPLSNTTEAPDNSNYLICNSIGTGAILLADILPTLILKLTFPFFLQKIPYSVKISLIGLFSASSFVVVAFAHKLWLSILGVVSASLGAGLGEITFLSLSTFYDKNVISSWSSGTGGAGVLGALAYAGLTSIGLSPRNTLLVMISVPTIMVLAYVFLLVHKHSAKRDSNENNDADDDRLTLLDNTKKEDKRLTLRRKFQLIPSLFKYMLPLSAVYFAEYFINQGLHELLYFNGEFISRKAQYRWFQVDYQIGVFISRSSVNLVKIKKLWILPILQFANMILLIFQVFYRFIPNLWIILAIIFWEGLLGGAAYVNTFYRMSIELADDIKEYCMGVATVADSLGIALSGIISIPTHNHICNLKLKI